MDAESHGMTEPQDIPVGSQTEAVAPPGTQIVRRTSGIQVQVDQRWLDDDWWEELESTAENDSEIPAEGEGHAEPEHDNPLRDAEDWSQEHHLRLDEAKQPTPNRSGDTVWRSVSGIDVHPPGSDVDEDAPVLLRPAFAEDSGIPPVPCVDSDAATPLRFQMLQNRPHSTGPVYITINDLPRDHRFLQVNVICPCVMPGPGEPDSIQLNHVLEPLVHELIQLKSGVTYRILNMYIQTHYDSRYQHGDPR